MDRKNLVEELQKAFQGDDRAQSAENEKGTEFVQNTNTLRVNEYTLPVEEEENKVQAMTEEELFSRLLKERRGK